MSGPEVDLVDRLEAAVLAVEGVVGLHAGVLGEVATYLPGRRIGGLRLRDDDCEVHVVLSFGSPVVETADRVRDAVRGLVAGRVDVTVEDVAPPA
ncbi:hypothetical protein ENKNEFLB_03735 [Nocardioides aquaticus]|uniref:Asp23/Gls24 family envelope stress response protein n=1 Tax=Nocardioides aquaticus TaxID=160826 RepID=A0ABX8ELB6_9ACTN|nr:hypothetical protein [Nocardioides aquaticus]QVT81327.1 hypothetical protein ENKNEFLB_03735 [Nocardioides aquaticus]